MQIQIPAVITGWVFLSPASIQHLEVNFNAAIKILKKENDCKGSSSSHLLWWELWIPKVIVYSDR